MAAADVSDLLYGIGSNLGDAIGRYRERSRLAQLGEPLKREDYKTAAQNFFGQGDYTTGLKLLRLGQEKSANESVTPLLGIGPSAGLGGGGEAEVYIKMAAAKRGIDPNVAVAVAKSEGLNSYTGDQGSSFGPFQLHYAGMAPGGNAVAGLGDEFTQATGLHARDPSTMQKQIDFALDHAARSGWGAFHGAANSGIGNFQGIRNTRLAGALPRPDTPAPLGAQKSVDALIARHAQLSNALATPNLGATVKDAIKAKIAETEFNLKRLDETVKFEREEGKGGRGYEDEVAARRRVIESQGGDPNDPRTQQFINTGRYAREDQSPLTATDKKAILDADDAVMAGENAIAALKEAKLISPAAAGFPGAGAGAKAVAWTGNQTAQATINLDNVVMSQAVESLRAIFGGMPTEGERKVLIELQGSSGLPDAVRQKIYDRAMNLAERRIGLNRDRAQQLRGGEFYKPREGGGRGEATQTQTPASAASTGLPRREPPRIGQVLGGYRFKGGNPADKNSWDRP